MSFSIPQTNPGANYRAHRSRIDAAVLRAMEGGWYILGEQAGTFEREFASWLGVEHAVGVGSGTDALEIALRACGVAPGEGVVTVSHTAVATVAAIERAGAVPLLADIDPLRYTLNPASAEEVIAGAKEHGIRVSAIVPVHLYGQMADMPALMELAGRYGLQVVEDCAQAHGATLDGRMAGTWGDAAAFSFYPTKNLGALGDGGAVATRNAAVLESVRLLREYGWRERYVSSVPGMNSRLDELQAAILRVKLPHLHEENARRRAIADLYNGRLTGSAIDQPARAEGAEHVYHQYVVRTPRRDEFRETLRSAGVGTLVHYPVPVHLQPAYRDRLALYSSMEATERAAREVVSLPMFPELSNEEAEYVAQSVRAAARPGIS
ncbi:MAG TPA: DegT/DnrJ/EryC1/StrS family aminotransferase [Candidatus Kapabacteria bacterium]|nr:DegT/DnrJ/EryC1/StrS family aminotransferase [Candidatus Kapabacteria bacterium]